MSVVMVGGYTSATSDAQWHVLSVVYENDVVEVEVDVVDVLVDEVVVLEVVVDEVVSVPVVVVPVVVVLVNTVVLYLEDVHTVAESNLHLAVRRDLLYADP